MNYVGAGRRFVAALLDTIILGVVSAILGGVLAGVVGVKAAGGINTSAIAGIATFSNLVSLVLGIAYYVFYQAKMGQTLGKKVMGIKVVDVGGKTPGVLTFFLREIVGKTVSALILFIGYLMIIWDGKKQGLHDKIASTYVIKV